MLLYDNAWLHFQSTKNCVFYYVAKVPAKMIEQFFMKIMLSSKLPVNDEQKIGTDNRLLTNEYAYCHYSPCDHNFRNNHMAESRLGCHRLRKMPAVHSLASLP